ncbi:uncharacterized protein TEOVI_000385600 [Trypanosoma equiperdum]|uniref:RNA-binding protein n=1 Tax=Trypanosoma equiperdum TaxID=5694 RepID=A0A1G4IIX7_TRYEQ|nr:hypothetical protein, conserved [Trypanosoma equiperdum]
MLFRETASETNSLADQDGFSSSEESMASCQSYATRQFEDRMRLLSLDDSEAGSSIGIWRSDANECGSLGFPTANEDCVGVSVFDEAFSGGTQISCLDCGEYEEWRSLMGAIDGRGDSSATFHAYPPSDYFKANPPPQSRAQECGTGGGGIASGHHGTKMFIGGLRFEVVQTGRRLISWVFEVACGVQVPVTSILVHRKAKGGRCGSPTGCASIFVVNEEDVESLLSMNQRIYCGARGIYVAASTEEMARLFEKEAITDIADGRKRGPSHPIVIERAYGAAGHPSARDSRAASAASASSRGVPVPRPLLTPGVVSKESQSPFDPSMTTFSSTASSLSSVVSLPSAPVSGACGADLSVSNQTSQQGGGDPRYVQYPGDGEANRLLQHVSEGLNCPSGVFLGGLPVEVTAVFVAWFFSLINVPVHPKNVSLGVDSHFTEKCGCASVRLEEADVLKATSWSKRVLCSSGGVCLADSHRALLNLQATRDKASPPSRPLFIKRLDAGRGVPCGSATTTSPSTLLVPATGVAPVDAPAPAPAPIPIPGPLPLGAPAAPGGPLPPAPLPVAWDGSQSAAPGPSLLPLREANLSSRPPPPPYMPNVIIGHQHYQVPAGASIQLQLVPVITAPGMVPTPIQPMFQAVPPPPPPLQ